MTINYNSSNDNEMGITYSANIPYLKGMCVWPLNTSSFGQLMYKLQL
jgi:hypothetical protein